MEKLKPIPKRSDQIINDNINNYYKSINKSDSDNIFTQNRGNEISLKNDNIKNITIGLQDIDNAIDYYFKEIIKPYVIDQGRKIPVPIIYGSQELWNDIQANGYYRDKNGKLMAPLISFKRNSIEKNRNLGNKLDGNKVNLYQTFELKYNNRNKYSNFSALNNIIPSKKFAVTIVPDYVNISYECVIFTNYMEHLNKLIESLNFASDSYWGDFNRFKFMTRIDGFTTITELNIGAERVCKANFVLNLNGYLIPNVINNELSSINRYYSKSRVNFKIENSTNNLE